MQYAQTIFIVVFATLLAFVNTFGIFNHDPEIGLLNFMARSNNILQQDPSRSLNCFNKYIPLINEIASNYETSFKACINESEAASARADEATLEQRNELANAAESSCALLQQCPENPTVEGIFQCYINGGSANLQTVYLINANASQQLATLREQYYLIQNSEYKCTNETKRVYEKNSAEAYAGLNNCILGNEDIATVEPSSTAQPTTETPIVTTSAEPETSDSPATTSNSPESTEIVTEETTNENPESTSEISSDATEDSSSDSPSTTTSVTERTETVPVETTTTETTSERTEDSSSDSPRSTASEPKSTETVPVETTTESPEENIFENPEELEDYNY